MRIIDRYLLRQYLQTFVVCYLSLLGLYIVFDAFTNLEEFIRCGEKSGGVLPLMAGFYGYQSIAFFDRISGLLGLVAAMFTVAWIQRHNEMTALLAAGVSRIRVLTPVIVAGIGVSVLGAINRETLLPRFAKELARQPQDLLGDVAQELQPRYDNQTGVLLRGKATYADRQRIEQPSFLLPPGLDDYGKHLGAKEARYCPPDGHRPGGYLFDGVEEPKGLEQRPSLSLGDVPVLITPADRPDWLRPGQCFVVSQVTFDQLTGGRAFRQFSSTAALIAGLRNPSLDYGADIRVAVHGRFVQPLLDVTLLFLGLPLVATRYQRNIFIAIGLCLVVVTVFMLTVIGLQYLGTVCLLDAALAAWAPLILFVPPAVALAEEMWR